MSRAEDKSAVWRAVSVARHWRRWARKLDARGERAEAEAVRVTARKRMLYARSLRDGTC